MCARPVLNNIKAVRSNIRVPMTSNIKPSNTDGPQVQGEGNHASDREYTESVQSFVKSGKVNQAARDASPESREDEKDMQRAEEAAQSHSKGEDPAIHSSSPVTP